MNCQVFCYSTLRCTDLSIWNNQHQLGCNHCKAIFEHLLPHEVHTGIKAGCTQMQKGRILLMVTFAVCHTSFWNYFSLETGSWQQISVLFSLPPGLSEWSSPLYIAYFTGDKFNSTYLSFLLLLCSNFVTDLGVDNSCYGLTKLCPCLSPKAPAAAQCRTQRGTLL